MSILRLVDFESGEVVHELDRDAVLGMLFAGGRMNVGTVRAVCEWAGLNYYSLMRAIIDNTPYEEE